MGFAGGNSGLDMRRRPDYTTANAFLSTPKIKKNAKCLKHFAFRCDNLINPIIGYHKHNTDKNQ